MSSNPKQQRVFKVDGGILILEYDKNDVVGEIDYDKPRNSSHVGITALFHLKETVEEVATISVVLLNNDGELITRGDVDKVHITGGQYSLGGDCCNYPPFRDHFTGTM